MALSYVDLHLFGHDLVARFFDHTHWWLHAVVHVVLLGGPLAFGAVLVLSARRWLVNIRQRILEARDAGATGADADGALVRGLFNYVLRQTWHSQLWLLLGAAITMPVLYATLELPKLIINNAIESGHFPVTFAGFTLGQVEFLFVLCLLFLVSVLLNGTLKYIVNLNKGRVGEALLRRLRTTVHREWRRRGRPGGHAQLIPVVVQEVEPIGGFSGDALVLPLFQGGTFLTILTFMIVQDPVLGAAAVTLLPLQLAVIPRLQRRINALGRERVKEIRRLGHFICDTGDEDGVSQLRSVQGSFRRVQEIRFEIYRRKFFMKGLTNFISHMTPFFFYTIGGYLVIEGRLSLGALVAVLSAYKDFSAPLRELFGYYQRLEDVRIRYEEIRLFLANRGSPHRPAPEPPQLRVRVPTVVAAE